MHAPGDGRAGGSGRLLAGRYRVTRQLGRGGMGVVCRAHDEVLGRDVAVKELRTFTDVAASELADFRLRMQREARAAARVRHPGVIAVHDIAEHEGRPVIVMELVDGPSLDDVLRDRGTLDPAEAADVGAKVLEALAAAHRAGVLHRDVKPGNILLERGGRVVLTDFGIAAVEEPGDGAATHLTRSGELVGSLDYLAPERARGEDPGPASDVWALGATLYAAVEGGSPFRRTSTWSTLTAIVSEPLPEPRNAGPLAPALGALLEKDPTRRPDAASAVALLRQVAAGAPGGAADTMRLGAVRGPRPPASVHPQGGPPPGVEAAHSAPTGGGPVHADRDTDRSTLSTRQERERSRRRTVVAASVVAVLLAGAGVAWGVSALGPEGEKQSAAASQSPAARQSSGSPSAGEEDSGKAGKAGKAGKESPSPEASAAPEDSPAPAAGGPDGGEDGAAGGGEDGGADGGAGGSDGGGSGGTDPGGSASGGSPGGTEPDPEPACRSIGGGKYDCQVWQTADSYDAQHRPVGTLYGGTNYFYCQSDLGYRETSGQWTNTWWAKTDDDNGNAGVWVSVVYIEGGDNDRPVPGLPAC